MVQPLWLLVEKYQSLLNDFIAISIDARGVLSFLLSGIVSLFFFFLLYQVGFIATRFMRVRENDAHLLRVALGSIIFGTCMLFLGAFSLFTPLILVSFLVGVTVVSFYFTDRKTVVSFLAKASSFCKQVLRTKVIGYFVIVFIFLAFLRLLLPETGVDALWYHMDYPKEYLRQGTMQIAPFGTYFVATTPQLAQMPYVYFVLFDLPLAARFFHFTFFLLTIILIYTIARTFAKDTSWIFAALLLVTSPIVLRHAAAGYVDFQWIFFWLLSVYLLINEKKLSGRSVFFAGIVFGGLLGTKLQALGIYPFFLLYIFWISRKRLSVVLRNIAIFVFSSMLVVFPWYIRSIVIIVTPFYPQFTRSENVLSGLQSIVLYLLENISVSKFLHLVNVHDFTILVGIGLLGLLFFPKTLRKAWMNNTLTKAVIVVGVVFALLPPAFYLGRHLLYPYTIFLLWLSLPMSIVYTRFIFVRFLILSFLFVISAYYFVSVLPLLPYGLGFADKNAYLSRVLENDDSSYFDFYRKFSPFIDPKDTILTYRVQGFYYADFMHEDFDQLRHGDEVTIVGLKKTGFTKLLVKKGNITVFCKQTKLPDCSEERFLLLAKHEPAKMYLYRIK